MFNWTGVRSTTSIITSSNRMAVFNRNSNTNNGNSMAIWLKIANKREGEWEI